MFNIIKRINCKSHKYKSKNLDACLFRNATIIVIIDILTLNMTIDYILINNL